MVLILESSWISADGLKIGDFHVIFRQKMGKHSAGFVIHKLRIVAGYNYKKLVNARDIHGCYVNSSRTH